ncbi:Uncharacterised protein [Legionella busanensis]|uniref:Type VII secretion system protein EssD-like domain-containing protein n=1 Tax=Legionella busanensis TaxID=190655 RepID=A0A378JHR1_9GAMM|nr:DNA/RNA non-specific endonuclease [Legionella busanensis]STX50301.1 Uncharacterised protein [Legionella busanensis]
MLSQAAENFKNLCIERIPALETFTWRDEALSDKQWENLYQEYQKAPVRPGQEQRKVTSQFIIYLLSCEFKADSTEVTAALQKKNPAREAKKRQRGQEEKAPAPLRSEKKIKKEIVASNQKIVATIEGATDAKLIQELEKRGIQVTQYTGEASPFKGYRSVETMYTPQGTNKLRKIGEVKVESKTRKVSRVKFFGKETPIKNDHQKGRVIIPNVKKKELREDKPQLVSNRLEPSEFEITLETIKKAKGNKRRIGQKQLTGASCREVFEAHGVETVVLVKGSKYHWGHLRGLCLGGQHTAAHLMPITAAANYNTLNLVEKPIIEKLTKKRENSNCIQSITVKVTPIYSEDSESLIPEVLNFELDWEEKISDTETNYKTKTIIINPCSYRPATSKECDALTSEDIENFLISPETIGAEGVDEDYLESSSPSPKR